MPEICRFFGIIITMNYNDHAPPHFHVRYGSDRAIIDPDEFRKVRVDPDLGTICWPNGADVDPLVLYSAVTGEPIDVADPALTASE